MKCPCCQVNQFRFRRGQRQTEMRVIAITYLALIIPALAQKLAQPNINDCMSSEYFLSTYDS